MSRQRLHSRSKIATRMSSSTHGWSSRTALLTSLILCQTRTVSIYDYIKRRIPVKTTSDSFPWREKSQWITTSVTARRPTGVLCLYDYIDQQVRCWLNILQRTVSYRRMPWLLTSYTCCITASFIQIKHNPKHFKLNNMLICRIINYHWHMDNPKHLIPRPSHQSSKFQRYYWLHTSSMLGFSDIPKVFSYLTRTSSSRMPCAMHCSHACLQNL